MNTNVGNIHLASLKIRLNIRHLYAGYFQMVPKNPLVPASCQITSCKENKRC